jgi:hypothetical protein
MLVPERDIFSFSSTAAGATILHRSARKRVGGCKNRGQPAPGASGSILKCKKVLGNGYR